MEQKTEYRQNEDGSYTAVTTTKTTLDDGFTHQADIVTSDFTNYGEYHKGYQINKHYETDNPKVVIPFLICMMIFILIFPIVGYFVGKSLGNYALFYIFLVFIIFFEIVIVKELIKVKKKFKDKNNINNNQNNINN